MSERRHEVLTPIRTVSVPGEYDLSGLRTPELSSTYSSAPSSAAIATPLQERAWRDVVDRSVVVPRSMKLLHEPSSISPELDVDDLLQQLRISDSPRPRSPQKGTRLFDIVGRGTHANVYRASLQGTEVAAKVANSRSAEPHIKREMDMLDHICRETPDLDYIVEHYHGQLSDSKLALFMELGRCDLFDYVKTEAKGASQDTRGPLLGQARWRSIAQKVTAAVAALHAIGVVHGDIKPQNFLWSADNVPKLIDFESAFTPCGRMPRAKNTENDIVGSNAYSAPELLRMDTRGPGFETDMFALGVTLLVLATGEEPYLRARNGIEMIIQCQSGDPIRYSQSKERVTPDVEKVVRGCCTKDPAKRWTIEQLADVLSAP